MKKLITCMIILFGLTVPVFANTVLNKVEKISGHILSADQLEEYVTKYQLKENANLLHSEEMPVRIFTSGSISVQFNLPMVVAVGNDYDLTVADETSKPYFEMLNKIEPKAVDRYFNDDEVLKMIQAQVANFSISEQVTRTNEIVDIVNQLRSLYRKIEFANFDNTADNSYYVYDMHNVLDNTNGQLFFGLNFEGQPFLTYDSSLPVISNGLINSGNILEDVSNNNSNFVNGTQSSSNGGNGSGNANGSGGNGNNANTAQSSTVDVIVLQDAEDYNHYNGEFDYYENARSAEMEVISKCWGEGCTQMLQNVVPAKDISCGTVRIDTKIKSYEFDMKPYYAQDTADKEHEVLMLLTENNLKQFRKRFEDEVINKLWKTETKDGKEVTVPDETARAKAKQSLENAINTARSAYGKIDVISTGFNAKDVYVHKTLLNDVDNTIFAINGENKLIGIHTDEFNDVFHQHELADEAYKTDIINSKNPESQTNPLQYRLSEENYYLCENCSRCKLCESQTLVASGRYNGNVYFSNYCPDHACFFVWDWEVDGNNVDGIQEGLKCIKQSEFGSIYCIDHKCQMCFAGIVGVSSVDAKAMTDHRMTGSIEANDYSKYCVAHKCIAKGCREAKIGIDTSSTYSDKGFSSPEYCEKHCTGCKFYESSIGDFCNEPVNDNLRMLCDKHLKVGVFEEINDGDLKMAMKYVSPDAKTLIFFGGVGEAYYDLSKTIACVENISNLENMNVICVSIPEHCWNGAKKELSDWNKPVAALRTYLETEIKNGNISADSLYIDGFSNGSQGAYDLATSLQGTQIAGKNVDVELTLIEGIRYAWEDNLYNFLDAGGQLNIYGAKSSTAGFGEAAAHFCKYKFNNDERVTKEIYNGKHNVTFVRSLYDTHGVHSQV